MAVRKTNEQMTDGGGGIPSTITPVTATPVPTPAPVINSAIPATNKLVTEPAPIQTTDGNTMRVPSPTGAQNVAVPTTVTGKTPSATQTAGYSPINPPANQVSGVTYDAQGKPIPTASQSGYSTAPRTTESTGASTTPTTGTGTTGGTTGGVTTGVEKTTTTQKADGGKSVTTEKPIVVDTGATSTPAKTAYDQQQSDYTNKLVDVINQPNAYLDKLNTMTFQYDPQSDPEYIRDSATIENQVAQMMVGRGGLYSSVAQSALQSALVSMQIDYRKTKFDEYKAERAFNLQMAQAEMDRRNTYFNQISALKDESQEERKTALAEAQQAWENQMTYANFKADQEYRAQQIEWERQDRIMALANAQYALEEKQIQAEIAEQSAGLEESYAQWKDIRTQFDKMMQSWMTKGNASKEVADFFTKKLGITVMSGSRYAENLSAIERAENKVNYMEYEIRNYAKELNATSEYLDLINLVKNPESTKTGTQTITTPILDANGTEIGKSTTTTNLYSNTYTPPETSGATIASKAYQAK